MTALPVLTPATPFRCEAYSCTLSMRDCVNRQRKRSAEYGGWKVATGKVPPHLYFCGSGKCEQGKRIRAALGDQKIEPPKNVDLAASWRSVQKKRAKEVSAPIVSKKAPAPRVKLPPKKRPAPKTDMAAMAGVCRHSIAKALAGKPLRHDVDAKVRPLLEAKGLAHLMAPVRPHKSRIRRVYAPGPRAYCEWQEEPCSEPLRNGNQTGLCKRHGAIRWARECRGIHGKPWKWVRPQKASAA